MDSVFSSYSYTFRFLAISHFPAEFTLIFEKFGSDFDLGSLLHEPMIASFNQTTRWRIKWRFQLFG